MTTSPSRTHRVVLLAAATALALARLPKTAVAVGPTGSDVTTDGGRTWTRFDTRSFDSVECAQTGACWASGAGGAAARLVVER